MKESWKKDFFEALEEYCGKLTSENALEKKNNGNYVLRNMFTTLQEGKGPVLYEAQLFQTQNELVQLEINVILDIDLKEDMISEFEMVTNQTNYYTPLGAFGIHYPSKRLYLRYVAVIDENRSIEDSVNEIGTIYKMLGGVVGNVYVGFERLNAGELTFEEAVAQNILLQQE